MQVDPDVERLGTAVSELVEGARRGMARSFDVTRQGLLRLAVTDGPIRPIDAADVLDVNPSTITRTAAALEADGLVAVHPDGQDGRSCRIAATEAGRRAFEESAAAGPRVFAAVIADWPVEDVRRFADYVERLANDWAERGPAATRPRRRPARPHWRMAADEGRQ
jgi:DNA-binding MarR family transcriptional regulator